MATAIAPIPDTPEIPVIGATVLECLRAHDWSYTELEHSWIKFRLVGDHAVYELFIQPNEKAETVLLRVIAPFRVNEELRGMVCELLNRINCRLRIGNFQLDYSDGEVTFRAAVDVEGGILVPKMIDSLIDAALYNFDWYYPGIMRVLYCLQSPEDAMRSLDPAHPQAA